MMKEMLYTLVGVLLVIFLQTCKEKPPEPPDTPQYKRNIFLFVEDTSVTEITLKVTIPESVKNREFIVKRDGQTLFTNVLTYSDTLLLDTALSPHHNYTYKAYRIKNNKLIDSSTFAFTTTMDTTSHNFTFEIDTLGDGNSSVLYDVAIINENDIWAVGEIYKKDSTGNFEPMYNTAHWDGAQWNLERVKFRLDYGSTVIITDRIPIKSLFAPTPDDIWFVCKVGGVTRYQNDQWTMMNFLLINGPSDANKVWGTSASDIYFIADNGLITHYDGSMWSKIESGTTADMRDVWGYIDYLHGSTIIISIASSPNETKLLSLSATSTHDTLSWQPTKRLLGIWNNKYATYVAGSGIWRFKGKKWKQMFGLPEEFYAGVRGTAENHIVAIGGNVMASFNGMNWHQYADIPIDFRFEALAVSPTMIVAVGYTVAGSFAEKASAVIGRRNH